MDFCTTFNITVFSYKTVCKTNKFILVNFLCQCCPNLLKISLKLHVSAAHIKGSINTGKKPIETKRCQLED